MLPKNLKIPLTTSFRSATIPLPNSPPGPAAVSRKNSAQNSPMVPLMHARKNMPTRMGGSLAMKFSSVSGTRSMSRSMISASIWISRSTSLRSLVTSDLTPESGPAARAAMCSPAPAPALAMTAAASAPNALPPTDDVDGVSTSCLSRRHSLSASPRARPVASVRGAPSLAPFAHTARPPARHRARVDAALAASEPTPACAATVAAMVGDLT
mmetsp:Transcript_2105/g.8888  ORF Transcript_2105/g.8888 Transcript_2105/m.8888 type:complete len:212 (+) Transcript_2105:123-758(+)